MCCNKFYLVIFYFIFIAFFASAPAFGALAAPVASHAEIRLFRAKEADKIAQSKNNLGTKLDVLGALTCLKEKLHKVPRTEISFIQFSRFVFGMLLGNGYPNGVTTTVRTTPAERIEIEKIVKEASIYVKKYDFKEPNIWSTDVHSAAQKMQHSNVLNSWWDGANRNEKLSIQPKNAEANAHNLAIDKQIFEGPYAEVPKAAMDALYKVDVNTANLIVRFIEYFSKLSDANKKFIFDYMKRNPKKYVADVLMPYIARELNKAIPPIAAAPAVLPPAPPPVVIAVANPRAAYEALIQGILTPDQREMLNEFITVALTPGLDEWKTDIIKEFINVYIQLPNQNKINVYIEMGNFIEPGFRQRHPLQREIDAFKVLLNNGDKIQIIMNLKWWLDEQIAHGVFALNAPVVAPVPIVAHAAIAAPAADPFIAKLTKDLIIADFTQTADSAIEKQNISRAAILLTNFKAIGIEAFNADMLSQQELENISRFATDFSKLSDADKNAICTHLDGLISSGTYSGAGRYEIEEMILAQRWENGGFINVLEPQIAQATKSENLGNLRLPVTYPLRSAEDLLRSKAELVKETCNYLRNQIANNSMQLLSEAQIAQEAANAALGFRWHFWKGPTGRAPARKHFNMPTPSPGQALTPRGMHFIEFFMNSVMPKLEELYYANKITANDIAYVLRAAGMGLVGLEEQELYLIQFRAYIDGFILDIDGKIPPVGCILASLPYYGNPYQKFPDTAANSHPFKEIEVEKQAPDVTPFHTIHAENQLEPYRDRYNIAVDQGNFTEVRKNTLKNDVIEGFKAALDNLSGLIETGFTSPISLGDEQKLIQFIKSFNTTFCYDGTTDVIAAKAIELGLIESATTAGAAQGPVTPEEAEQQFAAALMNPASKPQLAAIFKEIKVDGDNKLDGFIKAARAAAGAQGPDDYPPLHHTYLPAATVVLQNFFGNVEIIREVVGKNAAGNYALTDAQILELIYWSAAAIDGKQPPDPNIARLFGY